jgi:hypothetical protein
MIDTHNLYFSDQPQRAKNKSVSPYLLADQGVTAILRAAPISGRHRRRTIFLAGSLNQF